MRSEGYGTWSCVSVCLSVKSHLTSGASVRPENTVVYSAGNGGQKVVWGYGVKRKRKSHSSLWWSLHQILGIFDIQCKQGNVCMSVFAFTCTKCTCAIPLNISDMLADGVKPLEAERIANK